MGVGPFLWVQMNMDPFSGHNNSWTLIAEGKKDKPFLQETDDVSKCNWRTGADYYQTATIFTKANQTENNDFPYHANLPSYSEEQIRCL